MRHVLPPPVLGALVAAPSQIHLITFTIGRVLLAVLAGAEPGPVRTEPFQSKTASKSEKRPPIFIIPGDDSYQGSETAADPLQLKYETPMSASEAC